MKMRLLCLALATPALMAAQQPAPLPPNPLTAMFRLRTVTYQRQLAQAFDSIPESKFGYKPTPAQLTIGYVAQHLADDNYFYCSSFGPLKGTRAAKDTTTVWDGLSGRTGSGRTTLAGPAPRRLPVKASAIRSCPGP